MMRIESYLVYLVDCKETQTIIFSNYLLAGISNDKTEEAVHQFIT